MLGNSGDAVPDGTQQSMRNLNRVSVLWAIGVLLIAIVLPVGAATPIFNNSVYDLGHRFNPGTNEVGDEILLASTERYLTHFDFEFWGTNTLNDYSFAGTVQARVRFYENNGTLFNGYPSPGTAFFDSGWFSAGAPTARSIFIFTEGVDFPDGGLFLPSSDMTWSVQFQGMGATDSIGVDIYSPPVVGWDYPDYWESSNGSWQLLTNGVPMDFAARFYANQQVPEPSSAALSALGGLAILVAAYRVRRKQ
jgi:hypothetical protein